LQFQVLDIKDQCVGVYVGGDLRYDKLCLDGLHRTWGYANFLRDLDIEYASLYCGGKTLEEVCPDPLRDEWEPALNKLKAFYRALTEARIDLNENCFYDLVPENFIKDFCEIKDKITTHVFETYERPANYDFLMNLQEIISDIKVRSLQLNFSNFRNRVFQLQHKNWHEKLRSGRPYIDYNIFGTKTGRLTTKKFSFPILTMPKEYRQIVEPTNDWFLELDFNSAEIRTLLALSDLEQPEEDIHDWNVENVFGAGTTRNEAKTAIFAWLYNPTAKSAADNFYDKKKLLKKYWNGEQVETFYGKIIPSDEHHALNYIIQSTTSDLFLRRMIEVNKILESSKSHIAFCVHDSLVIDLHEEDKHLVPQIKKTFSETDLGVFKTNLSAGKNYGQLQELKI